MAGYRQLLCGDISPPLPSSLGRRPLAPLCCYERPRPELWLTFSGCHWSSKSYNEHTDPAARAFSAPEIFISAITAAHLQTQVSATIAHAANWGPGPRNCSLPRLRGHQFNPHNEVLPPDSRGRPPPQQWCLGLESELRCPSLISSKASGSAQALGSCSHPPSGPCSVPWNNTGPEGTRSPRSLRQAAGGPAHIDDVLPAKFRAYQAGFSSASCFGVCKKKRRVRSLQSLCPARQTGRGSEEAERPRLLPAKS